MKLLRDGNVMQWKIAYDTLVIKFKKTFKKDSKLPINASEILRC